MTRYLKNIDSLVFALAGFYVIYLYTKYSGVGLSPDSIMYASTATNIQAHASLLTFNKTPLVFFPVFYPFFLSVIQFISRVDPIQAGAMINASLFAIVIFTSGWIMSRFISPSRLWSWAYIYRWQLFKGWRVLITIAAVLIINYFIAYLLSYKVVVPDEVAWLSTSLFKPPLGSVYCWFLIISRVELVLIVAGTSYKRLILTAILLSVALLEVYTYLWSETLFIAEILLFIIAYSHYLHQHTLKALVWVAVVTAIACITRYVGITIIGTGGLMLLLDNELPWKKKTGHIVFYGAIAALPLALNLYINSKATGLSTGTREPSITPFSENLYYIGTVICDWGALSHKSYALAGLIASVIFISLIGILLFKTIKRKINSYENTVIAFAMVYGLFILLWATFQRFERINSRLLAPMFIPLLIACTSWIPDIIRLIKSKAKYVLAGVTIALMLCFEIATYRIDWQRYDDEGDYGVPGYSDDDWNKSEFVVYLKQHKGMFKPGIPIYTDADEAVYLFTGMSSTLIPHRFFNDKVQDFYKQKHFYLIWFGNLYNTELLSLPDIMKNKKLVKIGSAKEGAVYLCDEK